MGFTQLRNGFYALQGIAPPIVTSSALVTIALRNSYAYGAGFSQRRDRCRAQFYGVSAH